MGGNLLAVSGADNIDVGSGGINCNVSLTKARSFQKTASSIRHPGGEDAGGGC
jgi:hypothetical protein